jgi:hypothetical protein
LETNSIGRIGSKIDKGQEKEKEKEQINTSETLIEHFMIFFK